MTTSDLYGGRTFMGLRRLFLTGDHFESDRQARARRMTAIASVGPAVVAVRLLSLGGPSTLTGLPGATAAALVALGLGLFTESRGRGFVLLGTAVLIGVGLGSLCWVDPEYAEATGSIITTAVPAAGGSFVGLRDLRRSPAARSDLIPQAWGRRHRWVQAPRVPHLRSTTVQHLLDDLIRVVLAVPVSGGGRAGTRSTRRAG